VQGLQTKYNTKEFVHGNMGDLWFLNALSLMAINDNNIEGSQLLNKDFIGLDQKKTYDELLNQLCPLVFQQFQKYGLYVMRFYKNCSWRYVIIDDRIPCKDMEHSK